MQKQDCKEGPVLTMHWDTDLSSKDISLILSPGWLRSPCPAFPFAELSPKFELCLLVAFYPGLNDGTASKNPSLVFSLLFCTCVSFHRTIP